MAIVRATKYQLGAHVKEEDLLPEASACPICASADARTKVLHLQANPDVYLLRCGHCRGNSASRMPTDDRLRRYYSDYYEHADCAVTSDDPEGFARHVMATIAPYLKLPSVSILDFGGGGGDLSRAIAHLLLANGSAEIEIDLVDYNSNLNRTTAANTVTRAHQTLAEVGPR